MCIFWSKPLVLAFRLSQSWPHSLPGIVSVCGSTCTRTNDVVRCQCCRLSWYHATANIRAAWPAFSRYPNRPCHTTSAFHTASRCHQAAVRADLAALTACQVCDTLDLLMGAFSIFTTSNKKYKQSCLNAAADLTAYNRGIFDNCVTSLWPFNFIFLTWLAAAMDYIFISTFMLIAQAVSL